VKIPNRIQDLLPSEAVKQLVDLVAQPPLVQGLKEAAQRLGWKEAWQPSQLQDAMNQAKQWIETLSSRFRESGAKAAVGINATGQIFSDRWCATPWDDRALQAWLPLVSGFASNEQCQKNALGLIRAQTQAEQVLVTSSLPSALGLLAMHPQWSGGFAVPRTDCIRLEGRCDLKPMLELHGRSVREFGASNAYSMQDLESSRLGSGQALLSCWPTGFMPMAESPGEFRAGGSGPGSNPLREGLVHKAKSVGAASIEVLLDGCWLDLSGLGIDASLVPERLRAGVDVVVVPGQGLLGGPRAGLILGKDCVVGPLQELAARYSLLADGAVLAALVTCVESQADFATWSKTRLGAILANGMPNLESRAKRLAVQIGGCPWVQEVEVQSQSIPLGDPPWHTLRLPSTVLVIRLKGRSVEDVDRELRRRDTPIWTNIKPNRLECVLRTVDPADDVAVANAFPVPEAVD
jgi:hypothetical protein